MKRAFVLACTVACGGAAHDVVDLHVDLPYAIHVNHRALAAAQASPERLAMGHVRAIVTPIFVPGAFEMKPADVRAEYDATYADFRRAFPIRAESYLAFEGADGFADDFGALDAWIARGACLVGLVHDRSNALGGASQDPSTEARARAERDRKEARSVRRRARRAPRRGPRLRRDVRRSAPGLAGRGRSARRLAHGRAGAPRHHAQHR